MIDLSFLTEEEQESILVVLNRDAELKNTEEQRVRNLQQTVSDRDRLRYMTGEWFYETKQLRHQDRIHGSDIIRASMKHTHKPQGIVELSQIGPEKSGFISSEAHGVFVPAVLCGVLQKNQVNTEMYQKQNLYEMPQDMCTPHLLSPSKQRKNPFNIEISVTPTEDRTFLVGAADQSQTNSQGESYNIDVSEHWCLGILNPAVSALVSPEKDSGKPVHLETNPEEGCFLTASDWPAGHSLHQLPEQNTLIPVKASLDTKASTDGSSKGSYHTVSRKPEQRLVDISTRQKDKPIEQSPEGIKQKETQNCLDLSQEDAATNEHKPASVNQELMMFEMMLIRKLQLQRLQNITFKEAMTPVDADTQEETDGRGVPETLSSRRAILETDNSGPKILFTLEGTSTKCVNETGFESSYDPQINSDLDYINDLHQMVMTATADTSKESNVPQTDQSLVMYEEDGTYRADPVIIYDETDDCLMESMEVVQKSVSPVSLAALFNTQKRHWNTPVLLPVPVYSPQDNRPARIHELKNFNENKHTEPKATDTKIKETSICSAFTKKMTAPQSDVRSTLESKDKSEPVVPTSQQENQSNVVLKSLQAFVTQSPDRMRMSCATFGDAQSAHYQVKADSEALEMMLSSNESHIPRLEDLDNEIRRSPSKTCHPRVLPRESSCQKTSRLEGSLLKAFPIDIEPQVNVTEEPQAKLIPVQREMRSFFKEAKLTETTPCTINRSCLLPSDSVNNGTCVCGMNCSNPALSVQSIKPPEKMARSYGPQDLQHDLGSHGWGYIPAGHQEQAVAAESDLVCGPHNILREFVESQSNRFIEQNVPRFCSSAAQNKGVTCSQDTSNKALSLLHHSSNSVTFSTSEQKKTSLSVPVLQQFETDSDRNFETSLGFRRNTGSSVSNISVSSGMASMSSDSGSISSIYPADCGDPEVQGSIQFAMNYIQKHAEFHIFVVNCRNLLLADTKKNHSDPYVKCYLLPDKTKLGKRKTTVKKKTVNPTYNEIIRFKIMMEDLKIQTLNMSVWHNDPFRRNCFLGEVDVDMSEWDFSNTLINEYALKARVSGQTPSSTRLTDSRGQMSLALRFLLQTSHNKSHRETGEVQIWIKDCKNLPPVRGVLIDPFVKCIILPDKSRKNRQKTRVVKRTANPMFNHTMVYDGFRPEDLREACVEITVWDHDRVNHHYIGGLRIGPGTGRSYGMDVLWMDSTTDEANLWQKMFQCAGEWVEGVLPLRMLLMAKFMTD
ncbi:synaptotagmin-like protein 2 isoform X2 [Antennarius striatus]|uniref:synaptotagmin-like protein 2 isoform X2 n=1 Tax=Antennarius striatus TaxID=241820 RepID=UPI0035B08046